jgi:tRNA A-37 threonylcarbamoyl transferase component Bud32
MVSGPASASVVPGSLIGGRYSVEHALGKGGMGSVYAVIDLSTGRRLALKHLRREAAAENGPAAALFQREYHTLAHLRHPRVIQVYDYGVDASGRPFYTMELLDGSDLRELAPLAWPRACQVLRDVASSLALLHSRRLLYRDLSPRNVRCTRDGHAKLIDFGTMAPMGIAKDVAGTAPYVAPEAVHSQALDARTDLYALGALAYWTLTGYDAYPARDTRELRQLWPRPILPPSAIVADVPEALDALVMSLLNLDAQARPGHAAEVIVRLTSIAGLSPVDPIDVARAYLTSPTLIGYGEELASFHKRIVRAARGRGSSVVIRGGAGLGRSRLLQAFVLEAKLSGTHVLSADARYGQRGELGVMRALIEALCESLPEVALATFRPYADVLGAMFPVILAQLSDPPPLSAEQERREQHARVLQALRSWLAGAAQLRPLMIAVDDADHADEGSAACLALLAGDAAIVPLLLTIVVERESVLPALEVLCADATPIDLVPLDGDQTLKLLRSVFGEVPHLHAVAEWIASVAQGNPRTIMELSQYLVDHGIARYERGHFTLPETLRDQALPRSIEQAIDALLSLLSPPARALAEALALITEHGQLDIAEIARLSGQSSELTYGAVDELIAAQVLAVPGPLLGLRQRGLVRALRKGMSEQRRRLLHLRVAALYEARAGGSTRDVEDALLAAHHRYLGGDMDACMERLSAIASLGESAFGHTQEAVAMYEACLAHGEAIRLPAYRLYALRRVLLRLSSVADPSLIRHVEPTLEQLCRDSGRVYLADFADEPDPMRRIRRCIGQARRAHESMPESQRGLPPVEAIYELGASALTLTGTFVARHDADALGRLEALIEPFRPLSPVFDLLLSLASQAGEGLRGSDVRERRIKMLARLSLPVDGLEARSQHVIRNLITYWLGMDEAGVCSPRALEHAAALDRQPLYAPLGAQVRSIYHLFSGNEAEAQSSQRRRELMLLQSPFTHITSISGIAHEALGYYLCGSLLGLGRALAALQKLAASYPGWKQTLDHVEGLYALLRGEPKTALVLLQGPDAAPDRVQALLALGRAAEARAVAAEALPRYEREHRHALWMLRLRAAHALALSAAGERAAAASELDTHIERAERGGVSGMLLCVMSEARARIAVEMDDREAFRRNIRRLGATYGRGTSGLRARYEQLGVAARQALMSVPPQPIRAAVDAVEGSDVRSAMSAGATSAARLRCALELLVARARAVRGFLYGMQPGGLRLAATVGDLPPPDGIEDMLAVYMSAELDASQTVPNSVTGTFGATTEMVAWINDGQSLYYPVLLYSIHVQRRRVSGVALLALPVQRAPQLPPELVSEISRTLLDAGDVVGADAAD